MLLLIYIMILKTKRLPLIFNVEFLCKTMFYTSNKPVVMTGFKFKKTASRNRLAVFLSMLN